MEQKTKEIEAENIDLKRQLQLYKDQETRTKFINEMSKWIFNFKPTIDANEHEISFSGKSGNKFSYSIRNDHEIFFEKIIKPYVIYYNNKNMFLKNNLPYGSNKYAILIEIYTYFITEGCGDCKDDIKHNNMSVRFFFSDLPLDNVSQPRNLSDVKFKFLYTDHPTRHPPTLSYKDIYGITV